MSQPSFVPSAPHLLPLVVGVAGPPTLRPGDGPALESGLQELLAQLQARHPHTPLLLLSTLQGDAEQTAARLALRLGLQVVAQRSITAPTPTADLAPPNVLEVTVSGDLTAALAYHSHVLVTLATPDAPDARIDEVTRRMLAPGDPAEAGPVYPLVLAATAGQPPARPVPSLPAGHTADAEARIGARLDRFNREAGSPALPPDRQRSADDLLTPAEAASLPEPVKFLLDHYATTDALALRSQRRAGQTRRAFFGLLLLGLVLFSASAFELPGRFWLAGAAVVAVLAAVAFFLIVRVLGYEGAHIESRGLAEGLRVQLFWRLIGVTQPVANHYLRSQTGEINWIRRALRTTDLLASARADDGSLPSDQRLGLVLRCWLSGQAGFFERAVERARRRQRRRLWTFRASLGLTLLLLVLAPVFSWSVHVLVPLALAAVATLVVSSHVSRVAMTEHVNHFTWMRQYFADGVKDLQAGKNPAPLVEVLGLEALQESSGWTLLPAHRLFETPIH